MAVEPSDILQQSPHTIDCFYLEASHTVFLKRLSTRISGTCVFLFVVICYSQSWIIHRKHIYGWWWWWWRRGVFDKLYPYHKYDAKPQHKKYQTKLIPSDECHCSNVETNPDQNMGTNLKWLPPPSSNRAPSTPTTPQQHTQQKMHSNNDQFLLGVFTHYVEYMWFHL